MARVWYRVRDFDAGRAFYRDVLGFEEQLVDWDARWAQLDRGGMQIAHVEVDDVKAEAERLRQAGVEVGTVLELAGYVRLVDIYDPDGNRVQLAQELDDT